MNRFPLILLLVALFGCSPASNNPGPVAVPVTATADENFVQNLFLSHQLSAANVLLADPAYAFPAEDWIKNVFAPALRAEQLRQGVNLYEQPANNCTKFSRFSATLAAEIYYHDPQHKVGTGLAFGSFWYVRSSQPPLGTHSINVAICARPDKTPYLVFFEPQTCTLVQLTQKEVETGVLLF